MRQDFLDIQYRDGPLRKLGFLTLCLPPPLVGHGLTLYIPTTQTPLPPPTRRKLTAREEGKNILLLCALYAILCVLTG